MLQLCSLGLAAAMRLHHRAAAALAWGDKLCSQSRQHTLKVPKACKHLCIGELCDSIILADCKPQPDVSDEGVWTAHTVKSSGKVGRMHLQTFILDFYLSTQEGNLQSRCLRRGLKGCTDAKSS